MLINSTLLYCNLMIFGYFRVTHDLLLAFLPAPDSSLFFQDEMLASHVVCSHIRSHPDANPDEKTKKPKTNNTSHLTPISHWEDNIPNQIWLVVWNIIFAYDIYIYIDI